MLRSNNGNLEVPYLTISSGHSHVSGNYLPTYTDFFFGSFEEH